MASRSRLWHALAARYDTVVCFCGWQPDRKRSPGMAGEAAESARVKRNARSLAPVRNARSLAPLIEVREVREVVGFDRRGSRAYHHGCGRSNRCSDGLDDKAVVIVRLSNANPDWV